MKKYTIIEMGNKEQHIVYAKSFKDAASVFCGVNVNLYNIMRGIRGFSFGGKQYGIAL